MMSETARVDKSDPDEQSIAQYECPFCEASYATELLARVHVTRSDDDAHKNYDGFMPETQIEAVDEAGSTVESIERRPDEHNTSELERADLPDDFDERKQRVLLIGAYRSNADYAEVHDRATAAFEENDLEPVSYGTVRRWLRDFYEPQLETVEADDAEAEASLAELTPKQQAVVLARLDEPEASYSQLAERAGCSVAYPSSVLEQYEGLVETISSRLESGETIREIAEAELPADDLQRLREDDLLGREFFDEEHDLSGTDGETGITDGPVTGQAAHIMSASPADGATAEIETANTESADSGEDQPDAIESESVDSTADATSAESTATGSDVTEEESASAQSPDTQPRKDHEETVPAAEVEQIQDRISFISRVAEQELESNENERARTQLALAREVETQLEQVLAD